MFSGHESGVHRDETIASRTLKWIEKQAAFTVFLPVPENPSNVFCKVCRTEIPLASKGKKTLKQHLKRRKHIEKWMKKEGIIQGGRHASRKRFRKRKKHKSRGLSAVEVSTGGKDLQNSENSHQKPVQTSEYDDHFCSVRDHLIAPVIQTQQETFIENTAAVTATNTLESADTNSSKTVIKESKPNNGQEIDFPLRKEKSRDLESEDSSSFRSKVDAQDSEILWCLFCVRHHLPYSTFNTTDFQNMFSDSRLVQRTINHNPEKLAYITNYGLDLYYRTKLLCILEMVRHCVLVFKEIFYTVGGYKQIDMYIRFWNTDSHQVEMRYFISIFNKFDVQAEVLAEDIWSYLKDLENCKIIQMCLDGSPVSLQYLIHLQKKLDKHFSYDVVDLNNFLHSIYEAFERGEEASQWKLGDILQSLHLIFKDSPGRCAEYVKITKSHEFPLPFYSQRLLLNIQTAERAFEIWVNVRKYVCFVCTEYPSVSTSNYFTIVKQACDDDLMPVKLKFFISIGRRLENLVNLLKYEKPMLPFFNKLFKAFDNSCRYYSEIKKDICSDVGSVDRLVDFGLSNNTLPLLGEMRLGFSGEKILEQMTPSKLTTIQIAVLRASAQSFVLKLAEKLTNDPYLNNPLIEYLSCLDPLLAISNTEDCINKFSRILFLFQEKRLLCESMRQDLLEQFSLFLDDAVLYHKSDFERFDYTEENCRLDTFLHSYMSNVKYQKLWHFITGLLMLFNGQVDLSRFFALEEGVEFEDIDADYTTRRFISDHLICSNADAVVTDQMRGVVNEALRNRFDQDWNAGIRKISGIKSIH